MSTQHWPEGSPWSRYLLEHRQHIGPGYKLVDVGYGCISPDVHFYGRQTLTSRPSMPGRQRIEGSDFMRDSIIIIIIIIATVIVVYQ